MSLSVQQMFRDIAGRYDRANTVLSFGTHYLWRRTALQFAELESANTILDLCCGTGDFSFALASRLKTHPGKQKQIIGMDFVAEMVKIAQQKRITRQRTRAFSGNAEIPITFMTGDTMNLPLPNASVDAVTCAFGVRNLDDLALGLQEIKRVLKENGKVLILEFGQPKLPGLSHLYRTYSRFIMPKLGGWVTGHPQAYEYLPQTAAVFPCGKQFLEIMAQTGYTNLRSRALFGGIAFAYVGVNADMDERTDNYRSDSHAPQSAPRQIRGNE